MRETSEEMQAATAWTLGQIGRHTPEHAKAIAEAGILQILLDCYLQMNACEELKCKVREYLQ